MSKNRSQKIEFATISEIIDGSRERFVTACVEHLLAAATTDLTEEAIADEQPWSAKNIRVQMRLAIEAIKGDVPKIDAATLQDLASAFVRSGFREAIAGLQKKGVYPADAARQAVVYMEEGMEAFFNNQTQGRKIE